MFNFRKSNKKEKSEDFSFTIRTLEDDIKKLSHKKSASQATPVQKQQATQSQQQKEKSLPQKKKEDFIEKKEASGTSKSTSQTQPSFVSTQVSSVPPQPTHSSSKKPSWESKKDFPKKQEKQAPSSFPQPSLSKQPQEKEGVIPSFQTISKNLEKKEPVPGLESEPENPTPFLEKVLSEKNSGLFQKKIPSFSKEESSQKKVPSSTASFEEKTLSLQRPSSIPPQANQGRKMPTGPFFEANYSQKPLETNKAEPLSSQKAINAKKNDWLAKLKEKTAPKKTAFTKPSPATPSIPAAKPSQEKTLPTQTQTNLSEKKAPDKNPYQFLEEHVKKAQLQKAAGKIQPRPQVNKFLLSFAIIIFALSATFGFSYYFKVIKNEPIPFLDPILGKLFETEGVFSLVSKENRPHQEEPAPEKPLQSQNLSLKNGDFKKELLAYLENEAPNPDLGILILPEDKNGQKFSLSKIIQSLELDFSDLGAPEKKEGWIFAQKDSQKSVWLLGLVIKLAPEEKNQFEAGFRKMEKYLPQKMKGLYLEPLPSFDQEVIFRKSSFDSRVRYFNFSNDSLKRSLDYAFINRGNSFFLCIATSPNSMQNLIEIIDNTNR